MYFILEFKTPKSAKVITINMQGYGSYLNSHLFQSSPGNLIMV